MNGKELLVLVSPVCAVLYHRTRRGLVASASERNCRWPLTGVSGSAWAVMRKGRRRCRVGWLCGSRARGMFRVESNKKDLITER